MILTVSVLTGVIGQIPLMRGHTTRRLRSAPALKQTLQVVGKDASLGRPADGAESR